MKLTFKSVFNIYIGYFKWWLPAIDFINIIWLAFCQFCIVKKYKHKLLVLNCFSHAYSLLQCYEKQTITRSYWKVVQEFSTTIHKSQCEGRRFESRPHLDWAIWPKSKISYNYYESPSNLWICISFKNFLSLLCLKASKTNELICSQFHQHFTRAFFCTKFWRQKITKPNVSAL